LALVVVALITVAGTYLTAKLAQRGQHQSTKVSEAAGLLKSQVDFIDRQKVELSELRAENASLRLRVTGCEDRCGQLEAHVRRCDEDLSQLREDNTALLATIATQINIEADRPWPTDPHNPGGT
jgi:chromosome segregation ATPase